MVRFEPQCQSPCRAACAHHLVRPPGGFCFRQALMPCKWCVLKQSSMLFSSFHAAANASVVFAQTSPNSVQAFSSSVPQRKLLPVVSQFLQHLAHHRPSHLKAPFNIFHAPPCEIGTSRIKTLAIDHKGILPSNIAASTNTLG